MSRGVPIATGAGRGIGAAIARAAAAHGWTVVANYARDAASTEATVGAIGELGGRAQAIQADISALKATRRGLALSACGRSRRRLRSAAPESPRGWPHSPLSCCRQVRPT
jgi:NAD(P)-dependent dehydrogenase (short-subunit alcohol dehydrogenase family)